MAKKKISDIIPRESKTRTSNREGSASTVGSSGSTKSTPRLESILTKAKPRLFSSARKSKLEVRRGLGIDEKSMYSHASLMSSWGTGKTTRSMRRSAFFILVAALIVVTGYAVSLLFTKAFVEITPRTDIREIDQVITLLPGAGAHVEYDYMLISESLSESFTPLAKEHASVAAQGEVVIVNEDSEPEEFLPGAIVVSPDGLEYEILGDDTLVLPGANSDGPGSQIAKIRALKPGEAYNLSTGALYFKKWRDRSDARYTTQYAKITRSIQGGLIGFIPALDVTQKSELENRLTDRLDDILSTSYTAQVPEGYIVYPALAKVGYSPPVSEVKDNGEGTFRLSGYVQAVLMDRVKLSEYLVGQFYGVSDTDIHLVNLDQLDVSVVSVDGVGLAHNELPLTIRVQGKARFEWNVFSGDVRTTIRRQKKGSAKQLVEEYKSVSLVDVRVRPVWRARLPRKDSKFNISYKDSVLHNQ